MEKTVFILGAGASAELGAPVMRDFIDVAETIFASQQAAEDSSHFKLVFDGLRELRAVFSKATLDTRNLEAVFNAFETAELLEKLGDWAPEQIRELPKAMRRVIARTLRETINPQLPVVSTVQKFVQFLGKNSADATVLTFNYDLILDTNAVACGFGIDYCTGREKI